LAALGFQTAESKHKKMTGSEKGNYKKKLANEGATQLTSSGAWASSRQGKRGNAKTLLRSSQREKKKDERSRTARKKNKRERSIAATPPGSLNAATPPRGTKKG